MFFLLKSEGLLLRYPSLTTLPIAVKLQLGRSSSMSSFYLFVGYTDPSEYLVT